MQFVSEKMVKLFLNYDQQNFNRMSMKRTELFKRKPQLWKNVTGNWCVISVDLTRAHSLVNLLRPKHQNKRTETVLEPGR